MAGIQVNGSVLLAASPALYDLSAWSMTSSLDERPAGAPDGIADDIKNGADLNSYVRPGAFERGVGSYTFIVNSTDATSPGSIYPRVELKEPQPLTRPYNQTSELTVVCQLEGLVNDTNTPVQNEQVVIIQTWNDLEGDECQVTIQSGAASSTTADVRIRYNSTRGGTQESVTAFSNVIAVDANGVHDPIRVKLRRAADRLTLDLDVYANGIGSAATFTGSWNSDNGTNLTFSRTAGDPPYRWHMGNYFQNNQTTPVLTATLKHLSGTDAAPVIVPTGGNGTTLTAGTPIQLQQGTGPTVTFVQDVQYAYSTTGKLMVEHPATVNAPSGLTTTGTGRSGATVNPLFQGDHGWDDRYAINGGGGRNGANPLYHSSAVLGFPYVMSAGDSIGFYDSPVSWVDRGPNGKQYELHCVDVLPPNPGNRFAPEVLRGFNEVRAPQISVEFNFQTLLDNLPGGSAVTGTFPTGLTIPANDVSIAAIKTKVGQPFWLQAYTRVDTNPGGYEAGCPEDFLMGTADSGYSGSLGKTWAAAMRHVLDVNNTDADRIEVLKWVIDHGIQYFWPLYNDIDNVSNNGGGHFSANVIPAMVMLWAHHIMDPTGGYDTILQNYGTAAQAVRDNLEQGFEFQTAQMITDVIASHTSTLKPWTSRERQLISTPNASNEIVVFWDETNGDPDSLRAPGLEIRRVGSGSTSFGDIIDDTNRRTGSGQRTVTIAPNGNTASLAANDQIYFVPKWTPQLGDWGWCLQGIYTTATGTDAKYPSTYTTRFTVSGRTQTNYVPAQDSWSTYSGGSVRPHYLIDRQNQSFVMAALLAKIFGLENQPRWRPWVRLIVASEETNWPGTGINEFRDQEYTFLNIDGVNTTLGNFFDANKASVFTVAELDSANFLGYV